MCEKIKFKNLHIAAIVMMLVFGSFLLSSCSDDNDPPLVVEEGTTGSLSWKLDENGLLTISGTGEMPDYIYDVSTGGSSAPWFAYYKDIKKVKADNEVTTIGNYAFYKCQKIASVNLGKGISRIGEYAFFGCRELIDMNVPGKVTSIEQSAFSASGITRIALPDNLNIIGSQAFAGCEALSVITIPAGVNNIGNSVFTGCVKLTAIDVESANKDYVAENGVLFNKKKEVLIACPAGKQGDYSIPDGVKSIGDGAFKYCRDLTSISIPISVTTIDSYAFYYCSGLVRITIPQNVTTIRAYVFDYCPKLESIEVASANTVYLSEGGVLFNKAKTELYTYPQGKQGDYVIPDGVNLILENAFNDCQELTTVTIPASVTHIQPSSFTGNNNLKKVAILATMPPALGVDNFATKNGVLHVLAGTVDAYKATTWRNAFTTITDQP